MQKGNVSITKENNNNSSKMTFEAGDETHGVKVLAEEVKVLAEEASQGRKA